MAVDNMLIFLKTIPLALMEAASFCASFLARKIEQTAGLSS